MELNEYFEYRDGSLVWKARSSEFSTTKESQLSQRLEYKNTLGKFNSLLESNGYIRIRINGIKWLHTASYG